MITILMIDDDMWGKWFPRLMISMIDDFYDWWFPRLMISMIGDRCGGWFPWLMTDLMHRNGANPIPVWVLPYGGCWRDPRHPQGAAAVKLDQESTIWLLSLTGGAAKWLIRKERLGNYWPWYKTTEDDSYVLIGQTNKQTYSRGPLTRRVVFGFILWSVGFWRPTLCLQFVKR